MGPEIQCFSGLAADNAAQIGRITPHRAEALVEGHSGGRFRRHSMEKAPELNSRATFRADSGLTDSRTGHVAKTCALSFAIVFLPYKLPLLDYPSCMIT